MNDRINKTSICSVLFLDIIDYSKKSDADQIEIKNQFNDLINRSLKGVAQNDRIILDTGDGVAIAYMGSPEDAMFGAITIRNGILKSNMHNPKPLYVRFGINLGPVRIVNDINGQPNIIGDGINVAQRIMSFAQSNQILVSRSFYEITSRLTLEFSEMFDYSGIKHDKHVREHEVYTVRSHKDHIANASQPIAPKDDRRLTHRLVITNKVNWKYVALALPALVTFAVLIKAAWVPSESITPLTQSHMAIIPSAEAANIVKPIKLNNKDLMSTETVKENSALEELNDAKLKKAAIVKARLVKKEAKQKEMNEMPPEFVRTHTEIANNSIVVNKPREPVAKPAASVTRTAELAVQKIKIKQKSGWGASTDYVKQGKSDACTQAELAMNQCH